MGVRQETSIGAHFAPLPDPRADRGQEQLSLDSITVALCAVRCGADGWVAVATCGRAKERWLRTCLALPGGIPSHDTCWRVFARLDPVECRRGFLAWVRAVVPETAGQVVALDGKTLRRAHDRANGEAALHMVSAWACGNGLVLGQCAVDDKSNAITALPALLRRRDLAGATVPIDALGGQTAIAAQQADDVLARKDNHPTLHQEVVDAYAAARAGACADYAPADHDHRATVEQDQGRLERWRSRTIRDPALIAYRNQGNAWAGLRAVGLVERERRIGDTVTVAVRHDLLRGPGDAAACGHAVRSHRGIEHRVHGVLAVACREDERRVCVSDGAANLAVLRHFARNLLRQERTTTGSIATKRFRAALDEDYLLTVLAGLHQ